MNKTWNNSPESIAQRNASSPNEAATKQRDEEDYERAIKSLNRMGEREIDRALAAPPELCD